MNDRHGSARTVPAALVVLGVSFTILFVFLAAAVVGREEVHWLDERLLLLFRQADDLATPIGPRWLAQTMTELTALGGYPLLVILLVLLAGFLLVTGRYAIALYIALVTSSGMVAGHVLKLVYNRTRPEIVERLVETHTTAFPSGHATKSALVYLTLAFVAARLMRSSAGRAYVIGAALVLSFSIGLSRIYLGVHWPSDVLAGWALGAGWACVGWLIGRRFIPSGKEPPR
jgi:undecaprenyl-diphosphatase